MFRNIFVKFSLHCARCQLACNARLKISPDSDLKLFSSECKSKLKTLICLEYHVSETAFMRLILSLSFTLPKMLKKTNLQMHLDLITKYVIHYLDMITTNLLIIFLLYQFLCFYVNQSAASTKEFTAAGNQSP